MNTYETSATVESAGDIHVVGVPFAPGTEVEVTISPKRQSAAEFAAAWQRVCDELRRLPRAPTLTDDDFQQEVDDYRAGR
jgi:hypothetical protein